MLRLDTISPSKPEGDQVLINCLILSIAIVATMIRGDKRFPLLVFILPAIAFQATSFMVADDLFHLTACVLDLAVIILLIKMGNVNSMSLFIGLISAFSVCANIFGWLMYEGGFSSSAYDGVFTAIYALVLLASLMEWWNCARSTSNYSRVRGGFV